MTDPDERLSRRYRELAREEPPPLVDQAILASARRAVAPRTHGRWAVPVSIAAVLVLGIGVSLNMQSEKPGIETSAPAPASEYSVPQAVEPPTAAAPPEAPKPVQAPAKPKPAERKAMAPAPAPLEKRVEAAADQAAPAPQPEPKVFAESTPAAPPAAMATAPAPEPARRAATTNTLAATAPPPTMPAMTAQRAKEESAQVRRDAAAAPRDAREVELERIAKLRVDGRHDEADRALAEFRRRHPDYRIPEATWEKVKPR